MNKPTIKDLETRRKSLLSQLAAIGDFRPGKLGSYLRKCGKAGCRCATGDHGHGPYWRLIRARPGQTPLTHHVPEAALEMTQKHLDTHQHYKELTRELIEVSDALCQARIRRPGEEKKTVRRAKKPLARSPRSSPGRRRAKSTSC